MPARLLGLPGEHSVRATVVLGIGRPVSLSSGEHLEVCDAEHLLHVRCDRRGGDLIAIRARDCNLDPAPPAADAALGL